MARTIVVAGILGLFFSLLPFMWQYADKLKSNIFLKTIGKSESKNLDLDLITRLLITLILIACFWVPVGLILFYLDSINVLP